MEKKTDRRVRKTKAQLRAGLAKLMQTKSIKEITVKELVDEVDINRSTFYLHYTDIYQMLESIEDELEGEINQIVNNHPVDSYYKESFPMIKEILEVLWDNRDICNALLGSNGDMAFVLRMESIISQHSLHVLTTTFATAHEIHSPKFPKRMSAKSALPAAAPAPASFLSRTSGPDPSPGIGPGPQRTAAPRSAAAPWNPAHPVPGCGPGWHPEAG